MSKLMQPTNFPKTPNNSSMVKLFKFEPTTEFTPGIQTEKNYEFKTHNSSFNNSSVDDNVYNQSLEIQ